MAETNSTILGQIALVGSNDYQQRVPEATATDFASTVKFLFDPMKSIRIESGAEYTDVDGDSIGDADDDPEPRSIDELDLTI